jgi:hypothetical protein
MRTLLVVALLAGCGNRNSTPEPKKEFGCEQALRAASRNVAELQDAKHLGDAVAGCISDHWPADTRQCVATVRDKPDFVACMMRLDEQTKKLPAKPRRLGITGIEPNKGDAAGGTYVRITGDRFIADGARNAKVYFGSRQGTVVRFASDNELIVEAPGGNADETVDVLVIFEPGGEFKVPHGFTFVTHK